MNPVVIDTNCLLQIIARKSPYRPIWNAFLALTKCLTLCDGGHEKNGLMFGQSDFFL